MDAASVAGYFHKLLRGQEMSFLEHQITVGDLFAGVGVGLLLALCFLIYVIVAVNNGWVK